MALREIRTFDDSILRKKCRTVEEVNDKIRLLLDDMVDTMHHTPNGGGLSACQVGILKRLTVIDLGDGLIKLVNPEIIHSEGEQNEVEGCLSFPGVWGKVKRPKKVTVRALDENGEEITVEGENLMAVCLCHEIDHLNGVVFIDKATDIEKEI